MDLEVLFKVACGLDIHFAEVMACLVRTGPGGGPRYEIRNFATTLRGLTELREWILAAGCESVGMEATGVYWIPVYAALERHVPLVVGNPLHMQNLRGHKTDRKDAKWIAGLVRHGLIRPSFVPKPEFRDARELSRCRRQFIHEQTRVNNEIQRLLARQGITLGAVISDVCGGVSGAAILKALAEGRPVIEELPALIHYSLKPKLGMLSAALEAPLPEISRTLLAMHLERLEEIETRIQKIEGLLEQQLAPHKAQLDRIMTIPGIKRIAACTILAEIGVDMSAWPTEKHIAAWAGVAPGCRETGGKKKRAPSRKGNPYLCSILMECAGAAVKKKGCHLAGKYHRLVQQTGMKKKARMAIARKLMLIVYRILGGEAPYKEPTPKVISAKAKGKAVQKRVKDLQALGFEVTLTPIIDTP